MQIYSKRGANIYLHTCSMFPEVGDTLLRNTHVFCMQYVNTLKNKELQQNLWKHTRPTSQIKLS